MFIGTKKAKKYLDKIYNENKDNDKYLINKYTHLLDCLDIIKKYGIIDYILFKETVFLHDVGRFINDGKNKDFDHAIYGYELLKKEYTKKSRILLPIKYHESDLDWEELLENDDEYKKLSKLNKKIVKRGCRIVRDIDIISNMKQINNKNDSNLIKCDTFNKKLFKKLFNNEIGIKEDIISDIDQITYMLCGLNIITCNKSFKYLKGEKIIDKMISFQLMMTTNKRDYNYIEKNSLKIKEKFNL